MPPGARKYLDIGRITNHFIVDMNRFYNYTVFRLHMIVSKLCLFNSKFVPFALIFYVFLIIEEVG